MASLREDLAVIVALTLGCGGNGPPPTEGGADGSKDARSDADCKREIIDRESTIAIDDGTWCKLAEDWYGPCGSNPSPMVCQQACADYPTAAHPRGATPTPGWAS